MKLTGHLYLVHRDPGGETLAAWEVDNLIVDEGLATIAATILNGVDPAMDYVMLSESTDPPAPSDTYLSTTWGAGVSFDSLTAAGNVVTVVATIMGGPPYLTYYTAGLVRATPTEALIARALIGAVYLADLDTLTITWVITIS